MVRTAEPILKLQQCRGSKSELMTKATASPPICSPQRIVDILRRHYHRVLRRWSDSLKGNIGFSPHAVTSIRQVATALRPDAMLDEQAQLSRCVSVSLKHEPPEGFENEQSQYWPHLSTDAFYCALVCSVSGAGRSFLGTDGSKSMSAHVSQAGWWGTLGD
jgi:hypothetical protein